MKKNAEDHNSGRTIAPDTLAELVDLAYIAMIVRDPEGRILLWNRRAEETYGWTRDQALGQITHTLLQTQFPIPLEAVKAELAAHGRWEGELVQTRRDGTRLTVKSRQAVQRDERGAQEVILEVNFDLTAMKRAQAAQAHFRALFESAPGLYLVLRPEHYEIEAVSDAYLKATMTERRQIMGKTLFEVFPEDPNEPWADGMRNTLASLARVKDEGHADVMAVQRYPVRRPESEGGGFEERWWSPINSPVFGPEGELAYIIHRVEDVTPFIRQMQDQGRQADGLAMLETRAQHMEAEIVLRAQDLQRANVQLREREASLAKSEASLRDAAEELERRVAERTTALTETNQALQREVEEHRRTTARLLETGSRLRALAIHLEALREEERTRVARAVHDELGQALTGLKFDLTWLRGRLFEPNTVDDKEELLRKVADMMALTESTAEVVRQVAIDLRPSVLDDLGLLDALEWLCQQFERKSGVTCDFGLTVTSLALEPMTATELFRIAQELLTNVTRHAQATHVELALRREAGWLELEVRDNGVGFDPEGVGARKTLGLLGIRERAHLVGGSVTIRSAPGAGTQAVVRIPEAFEPVDAGGAA